MGSSSTNQSTQKVAFVSSNITSRSNETVNTAHGVSAANFKNNASTLANVDSPSDVVIYYFFARNRLEVADGNADNKRKEISQEDRKESRRHPGIKTAGTGRIPEGLNFMPSKSDLVLVDEDEYVFSESVTSVPTVATSKVKTSESKPKSVSKPLIED
ncbi:hypothetical protein Tco_0245260 [Tanacetum coccineum]